MIIRRRGRPTGFRMLKSSKEKISAAMKNKTVSLSTRMKISKTLMGNKNRRTHSDNFYTNLIHDYPDQDSKNWIVNHKEKLESTNIKTDREIYYFDNFNFSFNLNQFNYIDNSIQGIDPLDLLCISEKKFAAEKIL